MTPLSLLLFAQVIFWDQGPETAATLEKSGIKTIATPPEQATRWRQAGFTVVPLSPEDRKGRILLDAPGVNREITVSSPTQRPWIDANGWRFRRQSAARFFHEVPAGRAGLAAAEAHLHGADVILKVEGSDLETVARLLRLLNSIPARPWPDLAQIEVVDDGTDLVADVMNLLSRRNLLWRPRPAAREVPERPPTDDPDQRKRNVLTAPAAAQSVPASRDAWLPPRLRVQIGAREYPTEGAKDPSELAGRIRRKIGDARRALRVYGSEAVLCRVQAAGTGARISILNYGGGVREGIRVRLRGRYPRASAITDRVGSAPALDQAQTGAFTELTVPPFSVFAVVDLEK